MNTNKLIGMLMRLFMNKAVNTGIDYASRRGKDPKDMTPEERLQARKGRELGQKARKLSRMGRKLW